MPAPLFPTFFMTGFECSTFVWKDGKRKDYIALTAHDRFVEQDYECVESLGIKAVREAVCWPFVDKGRGQYDFGRVDPVLDAVERYGITPIWDLFHYGLPDGSDPFSEGCKKRFLDYCRAVAEHVVPRTKGPRFFTPINEITFFSGAATDMGWMYPFGKGRYAELKRALCQMSIDGAKVIREVDPDARMVHVDPIIHLVPPPDRPDLQDEADFHTYDQTFEAWDMLYGRMHPEMGGSPDILDIVGVNVYNFNQSMMKADGSREVLGPRDPQRKPLSELLMYTWERYRRPVIIGETSGWEDHRAEWLRMTMEESLKALNSGMDLQGICLYPFIDIPDWNTGKFAKIGMYDVDDAQTCERRPCEAYIKELRRWEKLLHQPESVDPSFDARDQGVQLDEVHQHAREWEGRTPGEQNVPEHTRREQAP